MLFAEDYSVVWQSLIAAVMTITLAAIQVWAKKGTTDAVEKSGKDASLAATKAAIKADEVQTALIVSKIETSAKLADVKTTLNESKIETSAKLSDVKAALESNTAITTETKTLVNGRHDAILDHVESLRKLLMEHGIDCPPPPAEIKAT